MKTLIIAEKPDMGRNIAAAIEPKAVNKRTHLEGQQYVITWAIGHLIGLAEPDHYDDKYKKWRFEDLPIIPEHFKLLPNPRTKDQLQVIAELSRTCDRIVNACDAGREGQLIFSYIQRHLNLKQPVQRLWISDLTAETIRSGFAALKDAAEYENLTRAARSRSEADWLIGMNGSRAFTTKHNVLLSVGRVQTPVLALIYDRQKQTEAFDSLKFYELAAMFRQDETEYRGLWQGERLTDPEKAAALRAKVHGKPGRIASYEAKETKEYPQKLYDLTLLQREANGKYGFSAKKTLDVAQALYEKHKVITYPRTSSNYVTEQNVPEMHRALNVLQGSAYDELVRGANRGLVHKGNKFVCNPAKVEDHHAILPTAKRASGLAPDEQKLYDLIVRRFLSQFYPAAEYRVHTVLTEVEGETFKTTVKQLLAEGWKVVYADQAETTAKAKKEKSSPAKDKDSDDAKEKEEEEVEVSTPFTLDAEAPVLCREAIVKEKETQPPKPYTEGTLLKAMESAGRSIEDEELRDAMKDSGLGTPATRAATIERLKNVGYITMQGKRIVITPKGRTAIELIRAAGIELLTSPEMTGQWERRLNEIAKGLASDDTFMDKVKTFASLIVDKVRGQARMAKTAFEGAAASASGDSGAGAGVRSKRGAASTRSGAGRELASRETPASSAAGRTAVSAAGAEAAAAATVEAARTAPAIVAVCPRPGCGGSIFMGKKGYGCSHYRTGCGFVIWKSSFGRSLTDAQVKALVEKGRTGKLKLSSDKGESFDGRIVLADPTTGRLQLERE